MSASPLVSVYIPTYSRINLLKRAVGSVLSQTYSNVEVIVVDDGSVDGTVEYLRSISSEDSRVRYYLNDTNSGACVSRNKAIKSARGSLVTGLDDDDYFLPGRIASLVDAWGEKDDRVVALSTNSIVLKGSGREKKTRRPKYVSKSDLLQENFIGNQVFTEANTILECGGYDEDFPAWQDLELWFRLLRKPGSRVECLDECSYVFDTSHPHERISTGRLDKIEKAYDLFVDKHGLNSSEASVLKFQVLCYRNIFPEFEVLLRKICDSPTVYCVKSVSSLLVKSVICRLFKR